MILLRWLTLLLGSLTVTLTVVLLWISFFLLTLLFVLQWLSLHWESLIILLSQFPLTSQYSRQDALLHHIAYDFSCADWHGLHDHLRDVPRDDILKLSASSAASKFCVWVQVGIDVYIPYCKYQVKPHSSSWFLAACAAAIAHTNHFCCCLYQQNKSSESKVKFRQASNYCKRVLEAAKFAYATKTKESITSQKLSSQDFWRIANSVLNKDKSALPPLFNSLELLSSASDKAKLFAKNFSKNFNLDDSVSFYLFSLLELI